MGSIPASGCVTAVLFGTFFAAALISEVFRLKIRTADHAYGDNRKLNLLVVPVTLSLLLCLGLAFCTAIKIVRMTIHKKLTT